MLAKVDALPGAQVQASVCYGQRQVAAQQAGFEMRRQVIRAFVGVFIERVSIGVGCEGLKVPFKIPAHSWVCIFIYELYESVFC